MKKLLFALLALCSTAWATTYTVPSFTSASVQTTFNTACAAGSGNIVSLPAGTYTWSSNVNVTCGNAITVTGPAVTGTVTTQTAILNATTGFGAFMSTSGTSTTLVLENMRFLLNSMAGVEGILLTGNNSGVSVLNNSMAGIYANPADPGGAPDLAYVDISGTINQTNSATVIKYNYLGDLSSCAGLYNANPTVPFDNNGHCIGIRANTGYALNTVIEYNVLYHVSEGYHAEQITPANSGSNGQPTSVNDGLVFKYNYILNWRRIGVEINANSATATQTIDHNVFAYPIVPFYGTMGISMACCSWGRIYGTVEGFNPSIVADDNLIIGVSTQGSYGIEWWGIGATGDFNVIEANWGAFYAVGYGLPPWEVHGNYLCGISGGQYFINEEGLPNQASVPTNLIWLSANKSSPMGYTATAATTATTCVQQTSTAPTIGSTGSGPFTVTLSDAQPGGNYSIYYTTDGSTPTVSSTLYTGPFSVSGGTLVSAVGMWGVAPQPTSYQAPYGWVPSAVVQQRFTGGSSPTLTGVTLVGSPNSVIVGNSIQMIPTAQYSDGTTTNCATTDVHGTLCGTYASTVPTHASVSTLGTVTGIAAGTTSITVHGGSFTSPGFTVTAVAAQPTLTGVTLTAGGVTTMTTSQTLQMTATATYTGGITTNCTASADAYGTTCGSWASSVPGYATVSSSGLVSGVSAGTTNITVVATGATASFTSLPPYAIAVTSAAPAATLTGVTVTFQTNSVTVGATIAGAAQCAYNLTAGGTTTTNCTTTDQYGTTAGTWASSSTGVATINPTTGVATGIGPGSTAITVVAGAFTSSNFNLTVTPAVTSNIGGNNQFDFSSSNNSAYRNSTYWVSGSNAAGYTSAVCNLYLTGTHAAGALWDCGIIDAPTATTEATSYRCHATYTTKGTADDDGFQPLGISGCGVIPNNSGEWVAVTTNEAGSPGEGFWDCNSATLGCNGSAPTSGNGTYAYRTISSVYGTYTGLGTTMLPTCTPGTTKCYQASTYVVLSTPPPTLVGGYVLAAGRLNVLTVGGSPLQFSAFCSYSDGTSFQCYPTADTYGNTATAFTSSAPSVMSMGNIGSATPGVATPITAGTASAQATLTGGVVATPWAVTVSSGVPTAPPGSGLRHHHR